jgi:cyclophilin family peptidyl-prolyl cis-trans isomerase
VIGRAAHASSLVGILLVATACTASPAPSTDLSTCPSAAPTASQAATILADAQRVVVATTKGSFTIELYPKAAPIAIANFVALARCGFYDQVSFHRVLAGFVAQAGDPKTRTNHGPFKGLGSGGPGYGFTVEFPDPSLAYDRYTVAMANSLQYDPVTGAIQGGLDSNRSQFFIDLESLVGRLPPYYTIIGKVVAGTDVIDAIGSAPVNNQADGVPVTPIIIESMTIESGA